MNPDLSPKPGSGDAVPRQPVMAVGTAIITAQPATCVVMTFSQLPRTVRFVSRTVAMRSRRLPVYSVVRRTCSCTSW
jgi:hypothetical protein